jgi:transcription initiation factor TFIID subunit TAF12
MRRARHNSSHTLASGRAKVTLVLTAALLLTGASYGAQWRAYRQRNEQQQQQQRRQQQQLGHEQQPQRVSAACAAGRSRVSRAAVSAMAAAAAGVAAPVAPRRVPANGTNSSDTSSPAELLSAPYTWCARSAGGRLWERAAQRAV